VELAGQAESFRKRGIGVASVIPEPAATIKEFATRHGLNYPALSDADAAIIRRFGLVDRTFEATGDLVGKDIPYAATFLVDEHGFIKEKFFEQAAENRRTTASILVLQGEPGTGGQEVKADHFTLRTSTSNAEVAPGQRFTLVLDFELEPKHHAYAPGVKGYRPLELDLAPDPLFEVHETRYPPAGTYYFAPLKETVPVFEDRFRVTKDVTVAMREALTRFKDAPEFPATVEGTLKYQICSDVVCYPPATQPLRFSVRARKWVR
jgi:AhpC/TSA family/Thiol:disulfide interchange protein DsbD, N-terminal